MKSLVFAFTLFASMSVQARLNLTQSKSEFQSVLNFTRKFPSFSISSMRTYQVGHQRFYEVERTNGYHSCTETYLMTYERSQEGQPRVYRSNCY